LLQFGRQSLSDLTSEVKAVLKTNAAKVRFRIHTGHASEFITGFGSADLANQCDMIWLCRKGGFTSGRTLMIGADKAAADSRSRLCRKVEKV